MEITGKIIKISEEQTFGNTIVKNIILKTDDKFPQELEVQFFNDKISILDSYKINDNIKVAINIRSNENNGRYYTKLVGWKCETLLGNQVTNEAQNPQRGVAQDLAF